MKHSIINIGLYILVNILNIIFAITLPYYEVLVALIVSNSIILIIGIITTEYTNNNKENNAKLNNIFKILTIITLAINLMFLFLDKTKLLEHFRSIDEAKKWINSFGVISWLVFFIIQILQVVVLPLPAQITTITGVLIFGPLQTFIISSVAVIFGSVICFGLGRLFGNKILYKISSEENVKKYQNLLTEKGKILLPIFFLLPVFPDDFLCFVAGTTNITWKYFIISTFLTRLVGIACMCWLGSGTVIPFNSWGIPVWIILVILIIIATTIILKNQSKIEEWITAKFNKRIK